MFGSDDEDADAFPGATLDTYNPQAAYNNSRHPPQPIRPTIPRSSNSRPQTSNYGPRPPRHVPWSSNDPIILPAADEDPFWEYPDSIKYNGFIITNEIQKNRHHTYSFMVFCQEDHKVYGIPRKLTTPPYGIKLNEEQRWRKKRDLEFGRKIDFIIDQRYDVLEYAKGPSDSIIAENIEGTNTFEVQCVLDADLMKFYCVEFGPSQMPRPLKYHIPNLAYECKVSFDEEKAIRKVPCFQIFKVLKAAAIQSIISTTPWVRNLPTPLLSDNDIEELKNPDNYKANVTGLRYANDRVLHLRAENHVKIIFCTAFDNLPPIGSIFQFDYVFHPLKKLAVVADVIKTNEQLPTTQLENGEDDESDYMFEMALNISEERNGFYHDEVLGMITDTKKCLRFAPYTKLQRPSDEINVRVKACLRQPALFDIVEVCEDSHCYIQACEPPFVQTDAVMVNLKSGKVFSAQYPNLDLRIHPNVCKKFKIGEFLNGTFHLNDRDNFSDNRYYCSDATKMNTEPLKSLTIDEDYALVIMKLKRVTYTAPVSKKQMKKNPQAEDVHVFRQYNFFLQDYFEATHGGLVGGTKGRVATSDDYCHSILETCPDGGQYTFNYVSKYEPVRYPLDLHQNAMLRNHVTKVRENRLGINNRHQSISTASVSSHTSAASHSSQASSAASTRSSFTSPSTGSSSSIPIPPFDDDVEIDASSRTSTPIAEIEGYSEISTRSMTSNSVRSERLQSPEIFSDSRYSEQNGYRNERANSRISNASRYERVDPRILANDGYESGDSRISRNSGYERVDPRISAQDRIDPRILANDGYESGDSRISREYERIDSRTSPYSQPPNSGRSSNAGPPSQPRHQYDRSSIDNRSVTSNTSATSSSRLPPNATWGRASAQPTTGNERIESRPDSSNSAPVSRPLPPTSTWANRVSAAPQTNTNGYIRNEAPRPTQNGSTWANRVSRPSESYENERTESRSSSIAAGPVFNVPSRPSSNGSSWASRASVNPAASNNRRLESAYSPPPVVTRPIPSGPLPHSGASSISSQNGPSHLKSHSPQNLSATSSRRTTESSPVSDITDRMSNSGISSVQLRREMHPQLGGPRYRNMCLYRRIENVSHGVSAILAQMDSLLTNPPPPITAAQSIKREPNEKSLPEFERFVEQYFE